ncbi:LysM domain-containing protein, partial [Cricetibacter osteomyelitidis]
EGYDEVILESAGGRVIFNGEGVTFEGNVRIEGELVFESGEAECTKVFTTQVHDAQPSDYQYSNRLDLYNIFGHLKGQNIAYTVKNAQDEVIYNGVLDEMARTERIYSDKQEKIKITIKVDNNNDEELIYEIELLETENVNNAPAEYRQAYYNVEEDDSLESISKKFNLSVDELIIINNFSEGKHSLLTNKLILPRNIYRKPN